MLKSPEKTVDVQRCLALADHLEKLPRSEFNMAKWSCCVYGHAFKLFGQGIFFGGALLGFDCSDGRWMQLFCPGPAATGGLGFSEITPQHAAKVVRHLALTGEVDWSVAK